MSDLWPGVLALILVVGTVGYAIWPPHSHRYIYLVGQQVHKGKSFQIIECVCGAQKTQTFPKEPE